MFSMHCNSATFLLIDHLIYGFPLSITEYELASARRPWHGGGIAAAHQRTGRRPVGPGPARQNLRELHRSSVRGAQQDCHSGALHSGAAARNVAGGEETPTGEGGGDQENAVGGAAQSVECKCCKDGRIIPEMSRQIIVPNSILIAKLFLPKLANWKISNDRK